METVRYSKRKRCLDDSPAIVLQSKVHLNERMIASRDSEKIKEIQQKTIQMLFQAAAQNRQPPVSTSNNQTISSRIILTGNGQIQLRDLSNGKLEFPRVEAKCCLRNTLCQFNCIVCRLPLCENCGYSCNDCGSFLCSNCVTVFHCGTVDNPVCENCAFFIKP